MTVKKAIHLAKERIKTCTEFIEGLKEYDREHPDTSEDQSGARIYNIVIRIVQSEISSLDEIVAILERKNDAKRTKKSL